MKGAAVICPACWSDRRHEQALGPDLSCEGCGTRFPEVEGVPILLADPEVRARLARGEGLDARTAFYQGETGFLREAPRSEATLGAALGLSRAEGLVLEIGSANGAFAGMGGEDYTALDFSLSLLRAHLPGRRRLCASAEAVPLASASCRFVFTVAVLEHVPRPDLAFEEIDRVLSPGGVAYVSPAWHCRDWAADGLPVRRFQELTFGQKLRKAAIPLRDSLAWRGAWQLPWRAFRRAATGFSGAPSRLCYKPLAANYERFWMSDSDACSSIDSHEGALFFSSRGYELIEPGPGPLRQLLFRAGPLVVRKPGA